MSNQFDTPPNLRLHINDLQDILASITLDDSADIESVWYEYWDSVLNYWVRRSSDGTLRLSLAPQRELIREILSGSTEADEDVLNCSFEADAGDTSTGSSSNPPGIQERINEAREGITTQSRIPDFTAFALRRHGLTHRHLICIIEIKSHVDIPQNHSRVAAPQLITQAKFAFDSFPDLLHVLSIFAYGDSWCLLRFPRDEVTQIYLERVEGFDDDDTFVLEKASMRRKTIDLSKFVVIPFSKVLKADGSDYSAAFEKAILITTGLKAWLDPLKFEWKC